MSQPRFNFDHIRFAAGQVPYTQAAFPFVPADSGKQISDVKQDIELPDGLSGKTKKNILALFERFGLDRIFGRTEVMEVLSLTASPASKLISKMLASDLIIPITGHGKGKYIYSQTVADHFANCEKAFRFIIFLVYLNHDSDYSQKK